MLVNNVTQMRYTPMQKNAVNMLPPATRILHTNAITFTD